MQCPHFVFTLPFLGEHKQPALTARKLLLPFLVSIALVAFPGSSMASPLISTLPTSLDDEIDLNTGLGGNDNSGLIDDILPDTDDDSPRDEEPDDADDDERPILGDDPRPTIPDRPDFCTINSSSFECRCIIGADSDGDGLLDCDEDIENVLVPEGDTCGSIEDGEDDFDEDGAPNCRDLCPTDPAKFEPGTCGCEYSDADATCRQNACRDGAEDLGCGCGVTRCDEEEQEVTVTRGPVLTKDTDTVEEPVVTVLPQTAPMLYDVQLQLMKFRSSARKRKRRKKGSKSTLGNLSHFTSTPTKTPTFALGSQRESRRRRRRRGAQWRVRYEVVVQMIQDNRLENFKRTRSRRNEIILRAMPPGEFVVRYRAMLSNRTKNKERRRARKIVHKTRFSPATTFVLGG